MRVLEIDTPHGVARAHVGGGGADVEGPGGGGGPRGAVVLGHGAGGGVGARDLVAVSAAAQQAGFAVALVEQP